METEIKICNDCLLKTAAKGRLKCWTCIDKNRQRSPESIEQRRVAAIERADKWLKANRPHVNNWRKNHRKKLDDGNNMS